MQRSKAIKNRIKTYFTLYSGKETAGELSAGAEMKPVRFSDCSLAGTAEEITSDVILPETRIPSTPEVGTESNSGDVTTEWNIDEQDDWLAGVVCGDWKDRQGGGKILKLEDAAHSFSLLKHYPQRPVAWQLYTREFINQLSMDFSTDSFVKLTWSFMGNNNPRKVFSDPLESLNPQYIDTLKTKSFITKSGFLKIGDDIENLTAIRQSPSMSITINNNLERTPALFEEESIENSLGNFDVSGTVDIYNVDDLGHEIYNDAVNGKDKVLQVQVKRTVNSVTTKYTLTLNVHLGAPSESRNGNKYQFSVPFTLNDDKDFSLVKEVEGGEPISAQTPTINENLADVTAAVNDSVSLDGTAVVTDGGTLSYRWTDSNDNVVGSEAVYSPNTESAGEETYTVTVTNSLNGTTATASKSATVTVSE